VSRLDEIRAAHLARTRQPISRRANPRPGDDVGRIEAGPGIGAEEATASARLQPWWPRRRTDVPRLARGWWVWPLTPAGG
jgi:hypothetical protein